MLTKIAIDQVASFGRKASLETTHRVNLVYGLNGSGKSSICKLLANPNAAEYQWCRIEDAATHRVLVFNQDFVRSNFHESTIPGIFTISKENKEIERAVDACKEKLAATRESYAGVLEEQRLTNEKQTADLEKLTDRLFDIKRTYAGGDRPLDFCLEGLQIKAKLAEHLLRLPKPEVEPQQTIKDLETEVTLLRESARRPPERMLPAVPTAKVSTSNPLLHTPIVGSSTSTFATFIEGLKNADWVREGMDSYIADGPTPKDCPFCQQRTITDVVIDELRSYFDKAYEAQVAELAKLENLQDVYKSSLPSLSDYQSSNFYESGIGTLHSLLVAAASRNLANLTRKRENPSVTVELEDTSSLVTELNAKIDACNQRINEHNTKARQLSESLSKVKSKFWTLMRWQHDASISLLKARRRDVAESGEAFQQRLDADSRLIAGLDAKLVELQQSVVNTDLAIRQINAELVKMGIVDFSVRKRLGSQHLYELARRNEERGEFQSLSEGEKMIISLLYFFVLITGTHDPKEKEERRVVVLDDPVSSLSHIYLFNVGRIIKEHLLRNSAIEQVFVFTHSLYFLYELTEVERRGEPPPQQLFRVTKTSEGSNIFPMKYEELQNDYHAYWQIVNDPTAPPALLANSMRSILEYFFGFVEKTSFANLFQKPELREPTFQAFCRYMNRESHAFGINVFDLKEFDYAAFKEGLRLVFNTAGYQKHYDKMSKM